MYMKVAHRRSCIAAHVDVILVLTRDIAVHADATVRESVLVLPLFAHERPSGQLSSEIAPLLGLLVLSDTSMCMLPLAVRLASRLPNASTR